MKVLVLSINSGKHCLKVNGSSDWPIESGPTQNPKFDWCWQTIAEAGCLGRKIFLCRGKLLGGSTCLNAQLALRGAPEDYDGWGQKGWTSEAMGREFKRVELRNGEPMDTCGMNVQVGDSIEILLNEEIP